MKRDSFKPILDSMLHEVLRDRRPPDVTDRVIKALAAAPEDGPFEGSEEYNSADVDHDEDSPADRLLGDLISHSLDSAPRLSEPADSDPSNADPVVSKSAEFSGDACEPSEIGSESLASSETKSQRSKKQLEDVADREVPPVLAINRGFTERSSRKRRKTVEAHEATSREWMLPAFWMACGAASILLVATISALVMNQGDGDGTVTDGSSLAASDDEQRELMRERESLNGEGLDRLNGSGLAEDNNGFRDPPPFGGDARENNRLANNGDSQSFAPKSDREMVSLVNHVIGNEIQRQAARPKAFIDDGLWHHRVFSVLMGRAPSDQEVSAFHRLGGTPEERREQIVDTLLSNESTRREVAKQWSSLLANDWIGSQGEQRERHLEQLASYLEKSLLSKRGLDAIAYELITANGADKPKHAEFNPAASFVISHADGGAQKRLASNVSRVFMGQRLDCVQCHQESLADDKSHIDFWQFNAFFRQVKLNRLSDGYSEIVEGDFKGDMNDTSDAVIFFEDDDGKVVAAYPSFNNELITNSGRLDEINRRTALAERLVRSADFRRVTVNRIWSHVFGVGMTRPVDEFGSHNPASHPTLLTDLADQLGAHQYQLEPVLKWMVLSDPFRRQSDSSWNLANTDSPHLGRRPLFSRYYDTWSRPADVLEAMTLVVQQRQELEDFEPGLSGILANIPSIPGAPIPEPRDTPTIDRDFANAFMMRTNEYPWGVSPRYEATLELVADSELSIENRIKHLFLIGLSRQPTGQELNRAKAMVEFRIQAGSSLPDSATAEKLGLQDVWWTLRMSDEFLH